MGAGRMKIKANRTVRNCYPKFLHLCIPVPGGDKDTMDILIHQKGPEKEFSLCSMQSQVTGYCISRRVKMQKKRTDIVPSLQL